MIMSGSSARRLPVITLIAQAGCALYRSAGDLILLSWLWLLLMAPVLFGLGWMEREYAPQLSGELPTWVVRTATELLRTLIQVPFWSSVAVGWQRRLLADERPVGRVHLRFDRVVRGFAAGLVLLLAAGWAVGLLLDGLQLIPGGFVVVGLAAALLGFVVLFGGLFLLARASLVLPARALDHAGFGWREALASTRTHNLEVAVGLLLCLVPNILLFRIVEAFAPEGTAVLYGVGHMGFHLINGLLLMLAIGFLALVYKTLHVPPMPSEEPTVRLMPGHSPP